MSEDSSVADAMWEGFKPDAARTIRAAQGFEDAVAGTLDRPFDIATHGPVMTALSELQASAAAAHRLSSLHPQGGI